MKRLIIPALMMLGFVGAALVAQEADKPEPAPAQDEQQVDEVSKQATQLEAELGKYKETQPEAAEVMLKLVDLYHTNARVFGVIRVARKFVTSHTTHEQHAAVMVKLIDGLEATARYDDMVTACRQFLGQYPDAAETSGVDARLTQVLDRMGKTQEAADAYASAWRRQPNEKGRMFGTAAIRRYGSINNNAMRQKAAELAEEMLDKTPKSEFADYVGLQAVEYWRGLNQYAKSNVAANKLLKKGLSGGNANLRRLHSTMANNYGGLGQNGNAVASLKKARALGEDAALHAQTLSYMYSNAETTPAEMEAELATFAQRYPDRTDLPYYRASLARKYYNLEDKSKALALIEQVLPLDGVTHSLAALYVSSNGSEPAQLAKSEQVLKNAIAKNEKHGAYLRYILAFNLYRDLMKDEAKVRATLRDLANKSPDDTGYSQGAINWLLSNAGSDAQFNADVVQLAKTRAANLHMGAYVGRLSEWAASAAQQAKSKKDQVLKQRAAFVRAELAKTNNDPVIKSWFKSGRAATMNAQASKYRAEVIKSGKLDALPEPMVRSILYHEGYYSRHHAPTNQRRRSVEFFGLYRKRFPKDADAAYLYVDACYNYGSPAESHEATENYVKLADSSSDPQRWYYLLYSADRNLSKAEDPDDVKAANLAKNKALVAQVLEHVKRSQQKFGPNPTYGSLIGDIVAKHGMEPAAQEYWKSIAAIGGDNSEVVACNLRLASEMQPAAKIAYLNQKLAEAGTMPGQYVQAIAAAYLETADVANFEKTIRPVIAYQNERAIWGSGFDEATLNDFITRMGVDTKAEEPREVPEADKLRIYTVVRDLRFNQSSAFAELKLLAATPADSMTPIERVLRYHRATLVAGNAHHYWDQLIGYAQQTLTKKDYLATATLVTGMLANIRNIDDSRRKAGRDMVAQSYSRIGAVGLTIDDKSPIAPLLQAALLLRLGDDRLAFEAYSANQALFDAHRNEMPVDFLMFICDKHLAAGGEANFNRVEDILRGWIVAYSESKQFDEATKARVQLLLAKNFFRARRFDIARSEYTTVKNRYPDTPEALEAEFGIGESFMAQKVYDQAEAVFDKLSGSRDTDVVIRAEFMRGVLAYRRGDKDEARDIFRGVLDRVPNIEIANRSLYRLSEVYGDEERYADQLNLLRTVGRLGRHSKRRHKPGVDLSIVVQDSDLGISQGHGKIPVIVRTIPGGDEELIYLRSGGGGKGLFRADLRTELGKVAKRDKSLQLSGKDMIKCDYPEEFKLNYKQVPLSDVDIRIAADGEFAVASSLIVDEEEETFSKKLEREVTEEEQDERVSQNRPANQIKPGNQIFMRVKDADRDMTDEADSIVVKLSAVSGDEVQVALTETGEHTGVFAATARTGELPAGALATDSAINHNPLMAIDQDRTTFWLSEPNGAVPKMLSVDMKDLKLVSRVRVSTPDPSNQAPVRGELLGSNDGEFWFHLASNPARPTVAPAAGEYAHMKRRVYAGNYTGYTTWQQVVDLTKNAQPLEEETVNELLWGLPEGEPESEAAEAAAKAYGVVWHGKFVQPRDGAVRFGVQGTRTALAVDGHVELEFGTTGRTADVWLRAGAHDLTIFAATAKGSTPVSAMRAKASLDASSAQLVPFRAEDFDLEQPLVKIAVGTVDRIAPEVVTADGDWEFRFEPIDLRHVRFVVQEYLGEAVAVSHVVVRGDEDDQLYIPTEDDVLALASNDILEIAGGDVITATYTDEQTQSELGHSRLLTQSLQATFFNAGISPIAYDFVKSSNGTVSTVRKDLVRIDPGERIVVEIVDYDMDQTDEPDTVKFQVMVNDGEPIELVATETENYSGIFTKEVDTSAMDEGGKLQVKQGDRIYCRYIDSQNTFPGHSVPRETVVFVLEPSEGQVRVVETRYSPPNPETNTGQKTTYLPRDDDNEIANVAFEVPLTVEVIDRDAAKDSRSSVEVLLSTPEGVNVKVKCVVSGEFGGATGYSGYSFGYGGNSANSNRLALEDGRFIGQVILQLGGKNSPDIVPLRADMPRNLTGGAIIEDEEQGATSSQLVTRVLNVTGKDVVTATYADKLRPDKVAQSLAAKGRLVTNGLLACTDRDYDKPVTQLRVGERMFLLVSDADHDTTDERDQVEVRVTTENGEKETIRLHETLAHSGVFSGSVAVKAAENPTPDNLDPEDAYIESYFGDLVDVTYIDTAASTESGELTQTIQLPVVIGTDGLVAAFSKTFNNEKLAVETKFHIAESYFELFKSHRQLERTDEERSDLESGRRILREVMEDYPDPKYVPRIAYLLGQFSQELKQWNDAIESYELITRQYSEHSLAPDAQYKLAQCYEEAGDFDEALEAYVTLAATYPKNPLIANVMIRISDYFYKNENFEVAAQVGEKFLERFEGHQYASRIAFRVGQSYYKGKLYNKASDSFDNFAKIFPDDQLCPDALFWSGESYRMANNNRFAFQRYNRCRWDFPASEAAKYSRGRLTLPEMLQLFESEATSLENDQ